MLKHYENTQVGYVPTLKEAVKDIDQRLNRLEAIVRNNGLLAKMSKAEAYKQATELADVAATEKKRRYTSKRQLEDQLAIANTQIESLRIQLKERDEEIEKAKERFERGVANNHELQRALSAVIIERDEARSTLNNLRQLVA